MRYQKIQTCIWQDEKFSRLSDDAKLLFLYILSSPHSNSLGLYVLPKGYIIEDLEWSMKRLAKPFQELLNIELIYYDESAKAVLVKNQLKYDPLANENQAKAAVKTLDSIPDTPLFKHLLKPLTEPYHKRLREQLEERLSKGIPEPSTYTNAFTNTKPKKDMSDSDESRPRTSSYSKEFEQLWQREWFGEKGSKKEAYQEFKKLKPDQKLLQTMINAIDNQVIHKKQKQKIPPDYFAENMPHVCRWIKKERWTDELPELKYTNGKYEPKRMTFVDKEAYDKFMSNPENQKKIKSGEIEVKFQKENYV